MGRRQALFAAAYTLVNFITAPMRRRCRRRAAHGCSSAWRETSSECSVMYFE